MHLNLCLSICFSKTWYSISYTVYSEIFELWHDFHTYKMKAIEGFRIGKIIPKIMRKSRQKWAVIRVIEEGITTLNFIIDFCPPPSHPSSLLYPLKRSWKHNNINTEFEGLFSFYKEQHFKSIEIKQIQYGMIRKHFFFWVTFYKCQYTN